MSEDAMFGVRVALGPSVAGWNRELGLCFIKTEPEGVIAEMEIAPRHHQPMGIVHGGVYCALVETVCSVGGHLAAAPRGQTVVGVDNHTSFLKAQRSGTLRATAVPITTGSRTQLWEARVENAHGELVATGRVRLICLDAGAPLAGEPARMKTRD